MSKVNCEAHLGAVSENKDFQNKIRIKSIPPGSYYELGDSGTI